MPHWQSVKAEVERLCSVFKMLENGWKAPTAVYDDAKNQTITMKKYYSALWNTRTNRHSHAIELQCLIGKTN
jgi:hypothetical protein